MRAAWQHIQAAFHDPETRQYKITELVIWVLISVSLITLVLDLSPAATWLPHSLVVALDRVILWFFVAEYFLRLLTVDPPARTLYRQTSSESLRSHVFARLRYAIRPLMVIDLITVLALVPALRALRAFRLFRLIRSARLFKYADPVMGVLRGFQENSLLYAGIFTLLGLTVAVGGVSLFLAEADANPAVETLADGLWWTLVTLTTVGYGDISPATTLGRAIGSVLMIAGMFTLALFAGIVGSSLLQAVLTLRNESFRWSSTMNHIVVCGYHDGVLMLLTELRKEVGSEVEIVLFADGERPGNLPPDYLWVSGDPTRESELAKARVTTARSVLVVARRDASPQQADAESILICFTIRSLLENDEEVAKRRRPLQIAMEILEAENVRHAEKAGADDIVDSSRLGFSLLARSVVSHGSAESIATLASGEGHRFYLEENPYDRQRTFGSISRDLLVERNVNTFGVYHVESHQLELGPSDDLVVAPIDRLVFLVPSRTVDG